MRGDRAMAAPYKAPIFITEFGTSDASGDNGFFRDATITWLSWAVQHNLSWCNWAFADKAECQRLEERSRPGTVEHGLGEWYAHPQHSAGPYFADGAE